MDSLETLSNDYDPSQFRLIGICADLYDRNGNLKPDQVEKAKKIIEDAGVTFTNLIPDEKFMNFFASTIVGFPTTYMVNSEGTIVDVTVGSKSYEGWKEYIDEQLEKMQ